MSDLELATALEDLPFRVQSASLKERKEVIENVIRFLDLPGISDSILKGICQIMHLTLPRYRDRTSQLLVRNLIVATLEKHLENGVKALTHTLYEIAQEQKNLIVTSNTSQTGLSALHWSCLLFEVGSKSNPELVKSNLSDIIDSQALLLTSVVSCGVEKRSSKAWNLLNNSWSAVLQSEMLYLEGLKKKEPSSHSVVLASYVFKRLKIINNNDLSKFEDYLNFFSDAFVKNFISTKTRPYAEVIKACYPLLNSITDEIFKKSLLPSLQKSMLRNPEIIIECVGLVLGGLHLDLSAYAADFGTSLIANLYSKDEQTRKEASKALQSLAGKITKPKSIEQLLEKIFHAFHGSQGKLTIVDHKLSVLEGAGNLSQNSIQDPSEIGTLCTNVIQHFLKVLKVEVHETTLCFALKMLSLWGDKFPERECVPMNLINGFSTTADLKTNTPLVKIAYIKCLLTFFERSCLDGGDQLSPSLLKSVEKAVAQPAQVLLVTEGLLSAVLLLKLNLAKENNFMNVLFDMDKQVFISDKFLSLTNKDGLLYGVQLCEILLMNYPERLNGKQSQLHRAILNCCLNSSSTKTRRNCLAVLRRMVARYGDLSLPISLLSELSVRLQDMDRNCENIPQVSSHSLIDCITSICSYQASENEEQLEIQALHALLPASHPKVVKESRKLWLKIVKFLKLKPKQLIARHFAHFKPIQNDLIKNYVKSATNENALSTLVMVNPDVVLLCAVERVCDWLKNPEICRVTKDDYFTFLTPDGELYDKSVVPGEDSNDAFNLKRESKAYSYKEQLEELQLRRELEEKKRKDGKIKPPKYTPKQLEAIKNQKIKEESIKARLSELNSIILNSVSMVQALACGSSMKLSLSFKKLLPEIMRNLQSPLAAPRLVKLFVHLRKTVFVRDDIMGDLIANVTLRLLKPQCDLDSNWEEEDLNKAMVRTVKRIHDLTVIKKNVFTVPAFTYTFAFLRLSMKSNYARNHDDVIHDGLQIISEHVKLRQSEGNGTRDINHPQYLPIQEIFQLLIEIISGTSGRVQSQAEACLLDVATCTSGESGCAKATTDEMDVLLSALENPAVVVRDAALRGLTIIIPKCLDQIPSQSDEFLRRLSKRLYVAKFDDNEENQQLAEQLWKLSGLDFDPELCLELLSDIEHPVESVQTAASKALAHLLEYNREKVEVTLNLLLILYKDRLQMIPAKMDEFGREIEKPIDTWFPRRGVAVALTNLAPLITANLIGDLIEFFVSTSLGDRNEIVRKEILNAALKIVDLHGKETVSTLWPVFDNFMGKSSKSATFDAVKQAVVILMGSLARHLDKDDPRIKPIVLRLIQALSTPSQTVQEAVGNCLPPLIPSVKDEAPGYINKLLHQLLKGDKYGERKGAAYGLAGLVKGMGILALKQHDIMTKLTEAIQDKKNYKHREGALFAFEMLFHMLGKLFEPYIIHVLPHLLQCFGDTSQYVRAAADDTAKVVMGKLSGHGVKLVLPSLLDALEQDSWRTKTGSVELLGAMAYCAPKQLSSCLPSIVPKLIEVLSDSHMKVQEAGADALKVIGSVIRNPEIQAIVPVLLKALQDPSNKTSVCLQTLLDTQFVHFIDAPSLALIMPVVQRAFMDRSTETRKMAAQIIGNMYSLTDQKDLLPYLPTIIPGLKQSLLDPVPEVRSVSARALGAMVRGMGEQSFEDLLPWLMQTLTSESSSVDRSGAAQGLSEVVGGLGVEKLHKLMPEIISTAERTDIAPHVKDGYIMMFIYMPGVFTNEFTPYIGQIINPILKALADENEYVRDTALKAGQRIVMLYAESAIQLLLPELENGLFDENWRIRYSSVQLLGDLLYRISGVTGKMSTETASEDDNFGTEQSHQAIIRCLGAERRNRVLAGLYMGRSDVALMVRQAALHVWKVVVTNTPRTLREILPTLFGLLLGCLASDSYDKRQVAARTLGDLVRKLGERVLPEIIPILERGLQSDQSDQRQGVCIGLSEIMASTSKDMVLTFVNSLVPTVRKALCDPLPEVRQAAAKTFDSLHSTVGARALDDILPTLLNQLNSDDPDIVEWTLDGLRQVMAIKSRVVLPYLVPQLTAPPANTKALSILASVAGEALNKYLPRILPALQIALAGSRNTPDEVQQLEYCQAVVLSVNDDVGIRTIIDTMLENTRSDNADQRRAAATLLCGFCANSKASYVTHIPQLLRGLIHLCIDEDKDVLQMCWEALNAITKSLEPKQQATYVSDVRQAVRYALSDLKAGNNLATVDLLLPGFCLPKGIAPILPIFREAILNGDGDEKDQAAQGLGEVIKVTSPQALQPSVVAITGPLIRILGDRFSPNVKTAVLETLAILLSKVGVMLKQFLPQLQTTFIKALNDPNRTVRLKSASALGHLISIHQRADPLFMELHNTIKNTDDVSIKETTLHALRGIITPAGDKMSDAVKKQIHATLLTLLGHPDEVTRLSAAGCLGAICRWLSPDQLDATCNEFLLVENAQSDWLLKHGRSAAISVALKESPATLWDDKYREKLIKTILGFLAFEKVPVVQCGVRSCGYLLQFLMTTDSTLPTNLLVPFVRTMNNNSNEVKQLLARVCIHLAKNVPEDKMSTELLKLLLPTLVNGTKEKNSYVKANSELALIEVLRLRNGDAMQQRCLSILDVGARESLSDVVSKVLKKLINQPEGKEEELDDTLLT